jgi:ribosomal protein S27AE
MSCDAHQFEDFPAGYDLDYFETHGDEPEQTPPIATVTDLTPTHRVYTMQGQNEHTQLVEDTRRDDVDLCPECGAVPEALAIHHDSINYRCGSCGLCWTVEPA